MSDAIRELVEREEADVAAEEAMNASPDVELPADTEPPAAVQAEEEALAAPAHEPPSDAAAEKALAAIEKKADRYVKDVTGISEGAELGLLECPLCPIPGFVPAEPDPDVSPAQRLAVMTVLGEGMPVEYQPASNLHACETCAGLGFLATGSNRDGFRDVECPTCMGKGFVDEDQRAALSLVQAPTAPGFPPPAPMPYADQPTGLHPSPVVQGGHSFQLVPGGSSDQHGRLPGHPLWGQPAEAGGF